MAFFDKLGKTVSDASQKTLAKTKEIADVTRLHAAISEAEKLAANQHLQIGKLYAQLHQDDYEEAFAGLFQILTAAEEKIRGCRKQLQEIKGVRICADCGAEVPPGSIFCSSCGTTMPKLPEPEVRDFVICKGCGAELEKGLRFCTSCGKAIEETPSAEEGGVTELMPDLVCPNCGAAVKDGLVFCAECGTKL